MDFLYIFMNHICPSVGAVIALLMFASPMKAVLQANKEKSLGELNPLPFVGIFANCTAWLLYGTLTKDPYVYFSNILGLPLGFFFIFTSLKFAPEQTQDRLRNIFLVFVAFFLVVGVVNLMAPLDYAGKKLLWGAAAVTVLGVYYVAPLSTVAKVLKQRDSSSLYWPLSMMNVINGCLWFAYGLAITDFFIFVPNGVGAAFNIVCLIMCFVFPAKNRPPKTDSETGFFRRFSSSLKGKGSQGPIQKDTEVIGTDVSKTDVESATTTNIVADSTSRL